MKLGTLPDGSPDGRLVVVSRDLTVCSDARHIAPSLAAALAAWEEVAPELALIAQGVEAEAQPVERFHERAAHAPLPRAGADAYDDPRATIAAPPGAGAVTAAVGLAFLAGGRERLPRLAVLALDLGPAGRSLSPVAVTLDDFAPGTLSIVVDGPAPHRIDAALTPPPISAAQDVVTRLAPVATLTLGPGACLRAELRDASRRSLFGAIERTVAPSET
jgi:hypothetical protein